MAKMENQTLAHQLKILIQDHYDGETQSFVCERVKYQVIPILISTFFDAPSIHRPSSSVLKEISLNPKPTQSQIQKENTKHPQQSPLSLNKLIGVFNLALSLQFLQLKKKGKTFKQIQQYLLMKEQILLHCNDIYQKQLKKLVIEKMKYQRTLSIQINSSMKIIGKVIERKMKNYFYFLKKMEVNKNTAKEINQIGIGLLGLVLRRRMRQIFKTIHSCSHNYWKQKIIRKMALNSPINFQISFWRLKNFHQSCEPIEKMVKLLNIHGKKSAFQLLKRPISEGREDLQQKCEYFFECLQNCQDIKNFSLLMEAFIALERC